MSTLIIKTDEGYVKQLEFINKKINTVLTKVLKQNKTKPIIILQGDHGIVRDIAFLGKKAEKNPLPISLIQQAFSILNAWYWPNKKFTFNEFSPVNNFRLIFDHYFDTKLGLLKNESFIHQQQSDKLTFTKINNFLNQSKNFTNKSIILH